MPAHPRSTPQRRLLRVGWLIAAGFVLNLLIGWSLLTIPRWTNPAQSRSIQYMDSSSPESIKSVYLHEHLWFGVYERQYFLTRRTRTRLTPKMISFYWTWAPWSTTTPPIDASRSLFATFAPSNPDATVISSIRVGFPALALQAETLIDDSVILPNNSLATDTRSGFMTPVDAIAANQNAGVWTHAQHLLFPYRPIWIGVLINTLFYTICIAIVSWVLRSIRHSRRMHRGRCPWCAYQLHYDFCDGCPECGWRRNTSQTAD